MSWDKREREERGRCGDAAEGKRSLEMNGNGEGEGRAKRDKGKKKAGAAWRSENKGVTAKGGRGRRRRGRGRAAWWAEGTKWGAKEGEGEAERKLLGSGRQRYMTSTLRPLEVMIPGAWGRGWGRWGTGGDGGETPCTRSANFRTHFNARLLVETKTECRAPRQPRFL